ncbi:MAG: asparagine synthase (glutamine-hydrolyzing) [Chitinophagaceae bacterium]
MPRIADIYSMCGIAGILSVNQHLVTKQRLAKMTEAIQHRGPDGEQHWINESGHVGLGHRRLAIIDLSDNAAQPMHYLQRYTIVHNGEIYNYKELRQSLISKGYVFTSQSDTEVILAAYNCWQQTCLQYFDGMFAFAIWDEKEQILFAARDRLGEKPFHYSYNDNAFVFASEIKALWAAGIEKEVNKTLLYNFITLGYTQNPADAAETIYNKIYQLPSAAFIKYSLREPQNISPTVYWQVDKNVQQNSITENNAVEKFTELFTSSIEARLRSDVPLGTSLSGGLDSSSIAVIIKNLQPANTNLQTFSAVFPGFAADESSYIRLLTKAKDIENYTVSPTADELVDDFEQLCYHQEGLMNSSSVYIQYRINKLAKQHGVKVLLDGQGADEILAGYHKYYHWYWQQLYMSDRKELQNEITAAGNNGIKEAFDWKNKLSAKFPSLAEAYTKRQRVKQQLNTAGLNTEFITAYGKSYYHLPLQNNLSNVLHYNTFCNGLNELLQYADRNSMAHGREVRLPFLNHSLVDFIFSLPASFKIKHGYTKWLLRQSMDKALPAAITWRKDKVGFEPPQQQWMQHPVLQQYVQQAREKLVAEAVLDKSVLNQPIKALPAHAANNFDWRYLVAARLF